jgi:hypothetical protein
MHKKSLGIFSALVILGGGFAASSFAHDGWDHHGFLHLEQGITLTATTNAPSGATGKAELVGECASGTNSSVLLVQTWGLTDGTYTVSVTDDTGTNTFVLGTFDVALYTNWGGHCEHPVLTNWFGGGCAFTNGFDFSAWTNWFGSGCAFTNSFDFSAWTNCAGLWTNWFGGGCAFTNGFDFTVWTNWVWHSVSTNAFNPGVCTNFAGLWTNWFGTCTSSNWPSHHRTNEVERGSGSFILPASLEATNVASVSISDSNSVVDLVGDFTSITNTVTCGFDTECDITPGTNWPDIQGSATITFTDVRGSEHGKFLLTAQGAPARQKYAVLVNGTAAGTVRSDKHGNVTIKNLHRKDMATVKTVVVTDANRNVVFSASF